MTLRTRVVIMFSAKPDVSSLLLANPDRLVIDMPETVFAFDKKSLSPARARHGRAIWPYEARAGPV